MADAPLISVVIPCFNQGGFLAEAIASVRRSTHPRVEVVVIDDGSTDNTSEVALNAGATCLRQANAGLANARNRGLRESRGEFIVFLDADDMLAPHALDIGAAALIAHPLSAFVFGRCIMMSREGVLQPTSAQPVIKTDHYRELLRKNYIWMPAMVMFRRGAVESCGGFNPRVHASADYELYLRIARSYPVHDHGQVVAYYRQHGTNMSSDAARMLRETLHVLRAERPSLDGDSASLQAYRSGWRTWQDFYGTHLVNEIRAHVHAGEIPQAMRKAAILGWYHPRGLAHHATRKLSLMLRLPTTPARPA